jgi:hypothetical protein
MAVDNQRTETNLADGLALRVVHEVSRVIKNDPSNLAFCRNIRVMRTPSSRETRQSQNFRNKGQTSTHSRSEQIRYQAKLNHQLTIFCDAPIV